jgi:hypothetical protein
LTSAFARDWLGGGIGGNAEAGGTAGAGATGAAGISLGRLQIVVIARRAQQRSNNKPKKEGARIHIEQGLRKTVALQAPPYTWIAHWLVIKIGQIFHIENV